MSTRHVTLLLKSRRGPPCCLPDGLQRPEHSTQILPKSAITVLLHLTSGPFRRLSHLSASSIPTLPNADSCTPQGLCPRWTLLHLTHFYTSFDTLFKRLLLHLSSQATPGIMVSFTCVFSEHWMQVFISALIRYFIYFYVFIFPAEL